MSTAVNVTPSDEHAASKATRAAHFVAPFQPAEIERVRSSFLAHMAGQFAFPILQPANFVSVKDVVKEYNRSLQVLQGIRTDANEFVTCLCRSFVSVPQQNDMVPAPLREAQQNEIEKLTEQASLPPIAASSHLYSELFELDANEAFSLLKTDFENSVRTFADSFLETLIKLQDLQVVGTIDWVGESGCRFRFFQMRLETDKPIRIQQNYSTDDPDGTWSREVKQTAEVQFTVHGQQQHLAHAHRHSLSSYPRAIPPQVFAVVQAIPTWLWPVVEIVEGDLFRTDKGKRLLKTETISVTEVGYHEDPAVVLGPFVLASWVCDEEAPRVHQPRQQTPHGQEANAELPTEEKRDLPWDRIQMLGPAVGRQVIPLLLHWAGSIFWPALHMFGLLLSLILLVPLLRAFRQAALECGVEPDASLLVLFGACSVFTVLGLQAGTLAVVYASFPLILACALLWGMAAFLARELVRSVNVSS